MVASPYGAVVEIPPFYVLYSNSNPLSGLRTFSGG